MTTMQTFDQGLATLRRRLKLFGLKDLEETFGLAGVQDPRPVECPYPQEIQRFINGGLCMFQDPHQLAALAKLVLAEGVKSFIEFGIYKGGDFICLVETLLSQGVKDVTAWACDIKTQPSVKAYFFNPQYHPSKFWNVPCTIQYTYAKSNQFPWGLPLRRFDLGLIDADHGIKHFWQDYEVLKPHCDILAFHDISDANLPEVGVGWAEVKRLNPSRRWVEIADPHPSQKAVGRTHLGWGVLLKETK